MAYPPWEYNWPCQKGWTATPFIGAGLSRSSGFADWKRLLRGIPMDLGLDVDCETDLVAVAQYDLKTKQVVIQPGGDKYQMRTSSRTKNTIQGPLPALLIEYSDSAFTNPHEVVLPDEPKHYSGVFTHMGARFGGLETRRHRATTVNAEQQALEYDHNAHNWFQIQLKERAEISLIKISTKWFTGNHVRAVSVFLKDELTGIEVQVLEREPLNPDTDHEHSIGPTAATECRIELFYEGGISRVNLFGNKSSEQLPQRDNLLERAMISDVSNVHYGKPGQAVRGNREVMHMVGWESARTGFGEHALFHLEKPASIDEVVVDTYLHRLNSPLTCHVFVLSDRDDNSTDQLMQTAPRWKLVFDNGKEVVPDDFQCYMLEQRYLGGENVPNREKFQIKLHTSDGSLWKPLLPFASLRPDTYHRFNDLEDCGPVTHVLYMHYPNGGIHGLKIYGAEAG